MVDSLTLYDRNVEGEDGLRCEWCGRPGQVLPFHVRSPQGAIEFAEPVLCAVCQGLIGYLHPHRSEQPQPPAVTPGEALAPSAEDRRADPLRRHAEAHEWAAGIVSRLLTERFVGEGRPRPAWAEGPSWTWPPGAPAT